MGMRLNPGAHSIRVEAAGLLPEEKTVTLLEAVKDMQAVFTLEAPRRATVLPTAEPERHARSSTAAWAFAIGSGVTLAGAGALGGVGWAMHENLKSSCGTSGGCTSTQVEPLRVLWPASFVALGVGVVSGIVSAVLFADRPRERDASALILAPDYVGIRF
jgi:hypothetical protein